jgi:hypothetical protein
LPADTNHFHSDIATGQLDNLIGKAVAEAWGQYLIGNPVAERGDGVGSGVGETVIKKADGLQSGNLRLDSRQVRAQGLAVGQLLAFGLKSFSLAAGCSLLKIGGVFPSVGL